jgi:hypothetical protein
MNREEAVDKATAIVEKLGAPVLNNRGYADGYKPPTLTERVQAILELAGFLWDVDPDQVTDVMSEDLPPQVLPDRMFGWALDGSEGKPRPAIVAVAQERLKQLEAGSVPIEVSERRALERIVWSSQQPGTVVPPRPTCDDPQA